MSKLINDFKKYTRKNAPENAIITQIRRFTKTPLFHFVVFGIILILFQQFCAQGFLFFKASWVTAIGRTMIYSMAALGFCLLLGYSGLASLGTAGFMGLAAYLAGTFLDKYGVPFSVSLVLVGLISVGIGCIIGFISLRIKGIFLAIITLGLSEILVSMFIALDSWTGGVRGMSIAYPQLLFGLIEIQREQIYFIITLTLVVLMAITTNLIKSPTGRAMLAMKNSTSAAQAFGISLMKYRLMAFIFATLYASIAGFMYMGLMRYSIPGTWSLGLSLNILAAVIIGGMKSIWGAIAGAFVLFGFDSIVLQNIEFFSNNPTLIMLFSGALIIVIVMFFPGGAPQIAFEIKQLIKKLYNKWKVRKYGSE